MTNIKHLPQAESTYKALQSFDSVEDMNAAVKSHKQAHELTQTDRDILDAISRYSCRYYGVTYLSKAKIANDAGYKSRRTAIRACKRLEALGIIEQYETRRVRGDLRRSSNVIVIKAVSETPVSQSNVTPVLHMGDGNHSANLHQGKAVDVLRLSDEIQGDSQNVHAECSIGQNKTEQQGDSHAEGTADSHRVKAFNKLSSRDTYKRLEPEKPSANEVIKRGLRHAIPTPIYEALAPFLDGQALYDTYGVLLRAKASIDRRIALETHGERYIDTYYAVIRLYKAGKVRSLNGLLYVAWERLSAEISRQTSRQSNDSLFAYNPYSDSVEA